MTRSEARQRYQEALWAIDHDPAYRREPMAVLVAVWASLVLLIVTFWVAAWWVVAWVVESVWRIVQNGGGL